MSVEEQTREVVTPTSTEGPTYCHVFQGTRANRSYCGVPRAEQPPHGADGRLPGTGASVTPFCPYCGLPRCPECAERSAEYGRRKGWA